MKFIKPLSVFLGTIIGVGIFGLPFVAQKAGFFIVFLYFLLMALIAIVIHYIYAEVVLGTKGIHRLPGYAAEYLGQKWKKLSFGIMIVGIMGALLAYLVVAGNFLNFLLSPYFGNNPILYTLLFFAFGAFLVARGIKSISQVELSLLVVFFVILILFLVKAFPFIDINHFKTIDLKFLALPYGVVLFSLWGSAMVPEIKEMINSKNQRKTLRRVIFWGIIIASLVYLSFIIIIFGASGNNTSKEAISGVADVLGGGIVGLGFVFGIITCFTSFIALALTLKKVFWYDFGISKNLSWFLVCFPPLILFFLGFREFIEIIGFTGALAIGAEGIIVVLLYKRFLEKVRSIKISPACYLLIIVFLLGIVLEVLYFCGFPLDKLL